MGALRNWTNSFLTDITSFVKKRDPKIWVFGEWFGKRCCDNCLYFANYVAEIHPELQFYWIAEPDTDTSALHPSIQVLLKDSQAARNILQVAAVGMVNQGLQDLDSSGLNYLFGALTINFWHGVPWKFIFRDYDKGNKYRTLWAIYDRIFWKFRDVSIYLASSKEMHRIYQRSKGVPKDYCILAGQPRNSILYSETAQKRAREKVLTWIHESVPDISTETLKIITYMPTFRDNTALQFDFNELAHCNPFLDFIEKENVMILQKAHFVNQERVGKNHNSSVQRICYVDTLSAQVLLAASDMLVTDYSSCFFDFLITDRPIVHYLYDYDYYANDDRGLYYKQEEVVCGAVAMTPDGLVASIKEEFCNPQKNAALREERRKQYLDYESPDSMNAIHEFIMSRL